MVYDTKTLEVLHGLTPKGEKDYRKFLEDEGTRILYKARHPVRYFIERFPEIISDIWNSFCDRLRGLLRR